MRRLLVLSLLILPACGDDTQMATGGAGGTAGTGGRDATMPDASSDAFVRGDGGFPDNIGAPCMQASDCGSGTDYRCEQFDFFGCSPGFCAKVCSDTMPCASGATCAKLPELSMTGAATEIDRCFLSCNTSNDCGAPGRLYCDTTRHICSAGQFLENLGTLGARTSAGATCSGTAPAPNRTVFNMNVAAISSGGPSEPHVALDPANPDIAYVAANVGDIAITTTATTTATFTTSSVRNVDPQNGGDPVLAVDPTTHDIWNVYLTPGDGVCPASGGFPGNNAIHVIHKAQGTGGSWVGPITVNPTMYTSPNYFNDKPWLHISPNGSIYVTWTAFPTAATATTSDIVLAASHDHGATWNSIVVNDATTDRAHGRQLSGMASDAANNLYIVWTEDTGNPNDLGGFTYFAKSTDGGATVTHPNVQVHQTAEAVFDDPQAAVTPDGSKLFIVYSAVVAGGGTDSNDVKATVSTDGGGTFGTPVKLNADASCATHWHPAAAVDGSGNLWTIYYDNQFGDDRIAWVKATASGNTVSVAAHGEVTDGVGPFTTSRTNFFLGDYIGLAYSTGKLAAVWGDLRNVAGGGRVQIFFASGTPQ